MAEAFTPINTEEEFAAAVAARYGDVATLQQQLQTVTGQRDTHAKTIEELKDNSEIEICDYGVYNDFKKLFPKEKCFIYDEY